MSKPTPLQNPLVATNCAACNWETSVLYLPQRLVDANKTGICYSRQLNGEYCQVKGEKWTKSVVNKSGKRVVEKNGEPMETQCDVDLDHNSTVYTFYHGCPKSAPWRAGDITERYRQRLRKDKEWTAQGWYCVSKEKCRSIFNETTMFHCDDENCISGACFGAQSGYGENAETLRCSQTHRPEGAFSIYSGGKDVLTWSSKLENHPNLNPQQCRQGFKKRANSPNDDFECVPCSGSDCPPKRCDFCHNLVISDTTSLFNVMGCTEIRTAGGIEISNVNDAEFLDQLEKAFSAVESVDCLSISQSDVIVDFRFLENLRTVTGTTWKITCSTKESCQQRMGNGKGAGFLNVTACTDKLSIKSE